MTPQLLLALVSILVAVGTFWLGRRSQRWTDQGAAEANANQTRQDVASLKSEVKQLGLDLATLRGALTATGKLDAPETAKLDQVVTGVASLKARLDLLDSRLGEKEDAIQTVHGRLDTMAHDVTVMKTMLGMEDTGKHIIEPFRGRAAGGVPELPDGGRK